ncbi:PIN domain-containing protein [Algiphilus sp. W345]|uniref:Ribonuclease VapC n=1 Tax=Banduia mediterranea TaxID=3075609 RepID=A0ABU2WMZ0_9GAMM|nr:PIN domain-containing protein [Algiphilus sp. W345]MDT0498989.1 PIN domain-containing protein [Algiphilus sp. W345]
MSVDFLDTNILLYHLDDSEPQKHRVARRLVESALAKGDACISFQVVQECLNAGLRKASIPMTPATARDYLDVVLAPLWRVMPTPELYRRGIDIQERYGFNFYDALIVSAAMQSGCRRLYSEDLQHGQKLDRLIVHNPFL